MDQEVFENLCTAVSNGRTDVILSIFSACENGSKEKNGSIPMSVHELLNKSCNPDGTLLHLATKLGHVDIARALLSYGADAHIENSFGQSSYDLVQSPEMSSVYIDELFKCSAESDIERIEQLVSAGVNLNSQDSPEGKNTALHWAVGFGKVAAVKCLLDLGAYPNSMNAVGLTPLHQGVLRQDVEIIKLLLSAGADPKIKSLSEKYFDKTAIDLADGNKDIIEYCAKYVHCDSGSEKSNSGSQTDQSAKDNVEDLCSSLQNLSYSSEPAFRNSLSQTTPIQSLHVPPFLMTPLPLVTDSKLHLLWPQPQKIMQSDEDFHKLLSNYSVQVVDCCTDVLSILDVWNTHISRLKLLGREFSVEDVVQSRENHSGHIVCHINPELFLITDSYKLIIMKEQIRILSAGIIGLHYALCTLEQLFSLYNEDGVIPCLTVHDWPQFQQRAVLLDFSYSARKPSLETVKEYILTMSSLKMKQLHCYFRYEQSNGHKLPFSQKELVELSRFCSQHFVTLIPAVDVSPQVEQVNSAAKTYIRDLAFKLMSLFTSRCLQIGPNLSKFILHEVERTKNFEIIWDMFHLSSSTVLYLCYEALNENSFEWLQFLPLNCILIDFGCRVEHNYDHNAKLISQFGLNISVGSGTSVWRSVAGSPERSISCLHKAAITASACGAVGMMVADFQSSPHLPAFCFSWPTIVLSLGLSWNASVHEDYIQSRLPELLNYHIYRDSADVTGYLNIEIGRLEEFMHNSVHRSCLEVGLLPHSEESVAYSLLLDSDAVLLDHFSLDLLQKVIRHVKEFELELQKAKPTCNYHDKVISELRLALDLIMFTCRLSKVMVSTGLNPAGNTCGLAVINLGITNLPPITRTDLANRLLDLIEEFRSVWLSRNMHCGLQSSLSMFTTLLLKLIPKADDASTVTGHLPMFQSLFAANNQTPE